MLNKKGKIFVLCGMIALLVVTGTLNVVLNRSTQDATQTSTITANADFFTAYRYDREQMRKEQFLSLDAIISSSVSSDDLCVMPKKRRPNLLWLWVRNLNLKRL